MFIAIKTAWLWYDHCGGYGMVGASVFIGYPDENDCYFGGVGAIIVYWCLLFLEIKFFWCDFS